MMKSLAILSNKGGVGKTSIAVNIAVYLAMQGKNVCLLDHDFNGPSMMTFFERKVNWFNDYALGNDKLENCLQDVSKSLEDESKSIKVPGKLFVGFANPTHDQIRHILSIDQAVNMRMLQNLIRLKRAIQKDPYNIDYFLIDSSPGAGFSTVNVIMVSDAALFLIKISNADLYGTSQMISGLYNNLKQKSMVLANQIPPAGLNDPDKKSKYEELVKQKLNEEIQEKSIEFLGWIPTDMILFEYEFFEAMKTLAGDKSNRKIYTLDNPDHIFSQTLISLVPKLFGE